MADAVVKFGTDGWRGIIADDFTYANVRVAARGIANYVLKHEDAKAGVCVGWDTRFGSRAFAGVVAEVLAGAGIPVQLATEVTPTPALSYAVRGRKATNRLGAAGGVMITSSHNPAQWNGVKYKASYGGSGTPAIMTAIEGYLETPLPAGRERAEIEEVNFNPEYVTAIAKFVDLDAIAKVGLQIFDRRYVWVRARGDCGDFCAGGDSVCGDTERVEPAVSGDQSGADTAAY
jgi:phosphomannomutase